MNADLLWSYIGMVDPQADPRIGDDAPELWTWIRNGHWFDLAKTNDPTVERPVCSLQSRYR